MFPALFISISFRKTEHLHIKWIWRSFLNMLIWVHKKILISVAGQLKIVAELLNCWKSKNEKLVIEFKGCASYRKLQPTSWYICTNRVIGIKGVLETTNPIMDTGCIKPIISVMLKSVEFLTPHTGLIISNYRCIVIYITCFLPRNVTFKNRKWRCLRKVQSHMT